MSSKKVTVHMSVSVPVNFELVALVPQDLDEGEVAILNVRRMGATVSDPEELYGYMGSDDLDELERLAMKATKENS